MREYQIFCDSSCDTALELLEAYRIVRIPFYVSFDQQTYEKEIEEISLDRFYQRLTGEKVFPKTSLPSVQDYLNHFYKALELDKDILCICLTANFSGSYQSAVTARDILLEEHPDAAIYIVNSLQATGGEGITLMQAAKMQADGFSLEENFAVLQKLKDTSRIMFTVGTLEYLQKGGRIGKVSSLAGSLLNLKPLIQLKEGELIPYGTIRGRNRSLAKVVAMVDEHFTKIGENMADYDFGIISGLCHDEAAYLQTCVEELIGRPVEYPVFPIGVTIGTNTGPDALGVCFIKKYTKI